MSYTVMRVFDLFNPGRLMGQEVNYLLADNDNNLVVGAHAASAVVVKV